MADLRPFEVPSPGWWWIDGDRERFPEDDGLFTNLLPNLRLRLAVPSEQMTCQPGVLLH